MGNDRNSSRSDTTPLCPRVRSAQDVVAIMGNSEADGDVSDSVVAVMGNVTVNGTVGNGGAVAVLGNAYINGKVDGDVVAVLGNVTLGPHAVINGDVTEVMGTIERSPTTVIHGGTVGVMSGFFGDVEWLHAWIRHCLVFGRPLAPSLDVAWAWWFALGVLALYVLIAAIFRDGIRRCVTDAGNASRPIHPRHVHRGVAAARRTAGPLHHRHRHPRHSPARGSR